MCVHIWFFLYLKGVLINLPLLVVFFVILLIGVGMFIFCVLLNIFSESCLLLNCLLSLVFLVSVIYFFLWLVLVQFLLNTILVIVVAPERVSNENTNMDIR